MKRLAIITTVALALFGSIGSLISEASDHSNPLKYEAFALQNLTGKTITYQVTWGNETRSIVLAPGKIWNQARPLSSGATSAPVVRFASGGITRSYNIGTSLSDTMYGGLVYALRVRNDGSIGLFKN